MAKRPRHPDKDIEAAVKYAEANGWIWTPSGGHAWGVFAKIHDGYHSGALHVGLTAWYADKAGRVHRYRISWVRHVRNADYASWSQWAMAATSGPVITLQTCDGATSAYRILVRLVPA